MYAFMCVKVRKGILVSHPTSLTVKVYQIIMEVKKFSASLPEAYLREGGLERVIERFNLLPMLNHGADGLDTCL